MPRRVRVRALDGATAKKLVGQRFTKAAAIAMQGSDGNPMADGYTCMYRMMEVPTDKIYPGARASDPLDGLLHPEQVPGMVEAIRRGEYLPPLQVSYSWDLMDGHHRFAAALIAEAPTVLALVPEDLLNEGGD